MVGETRNYHTLDGMRGAAVIVVLLYHCDGFFGFPAAPHSYLAVDFFFALSGFVLVHAYGSKMSAGLGFETFTKIRLIRFYPMYLLGIILGLLARGATFLQHHHPLAGLALVGMALAGLPSSSPFHLRESLYPLDGPAWSLFFEVGINMVLVLIWKRLSGRLLVILIAAGFVGFLASAPFSSSLGWDWGGFMTGCGRVVFSFFLGVALYRWRARLPIPRLNAWTVAAATVLLLLLAPIPEGTIWSALYDLAALLIGIPLLLALGAATEPAAWAAPWFKWAGVTSYGVYILHDPLLTWAHEIVSATGFNPIAMVVLFVPFVIAVAWVADRYYDLPVRRWLSRTFVPRRPVAAPGLA